MPDEKEDKRPWYKKTRIQGLGIMIVGIALLCNPVTAPAAPYVLSLGAGWASGGVNAKLTRGEKLLK